MMTKLMAIWCWAMGGAGVGRHTGRGVGARLQIIVVEMVSIDVRGARSFGSDDDVGSYGLS